MKPTINDDGSTDVALSQTDMTLLRKAKGLARLIKQNITPASNLAVRAEAAEAELRKLLHVLDSIAEASTLPELSQDDMDEAAEAAAEMQPAERPDEKDMADQATH